MDEQQKRAFAEAVERKKQEAARKATMHQPTGTAPPEVVGQGSQENVDAPTTSADQPTPHHKSQRHGNVTAENWNQ
jgi:hypothetical protein